MRQRKSPYSLWLLTVFFIGLFIKLFLWSKTNYLSRDSVLYLDYIEKWYSAGWRYDKVVMPVLEFPPLYFYLTQALMRVGVSATHAGLTINMILGSTIPILAFCIAKEITNNNKISLACLLVVLFHPTLNKFSIETQRDIGYLFFSCLGILMLLKSRSSTKYLYPIYTGLFIGLSLLFRFESLELLPIGAFLLFLRKTGFLDFNRKMVLILSSAAICFICVSALMGLTFSDIRQIYYDLYLDRATA